MSSHELITAIADDGSYYPVEKLEAHIRNIRHLAVSVFIFNSGRLLLQKRAAGKHHSGLLWANTCCSHPRWQESPEECARREIEEETGVRCGRRISELSPTYHIYQHDNDYYLKKTYWFLFTLEGDGKTIPQLKEGITEAKWLDRESVSGIRDLMWLSVGY